MITLEKFKQMYLLTPIAQRKSLDFFIDNINKNWISMVSLLKGFNPPLYCRCGRNSEHGKETDINHDKFYSGLLIDIGEEEE